MTTPTATIHIRPGATIDLPFILTTFAKSYQDTSAFAAGAPAPVLGELMRGLCAGPWPTLVAVDPDDDTAILGWIVFKNENTVAWLYVRPELRRKGLARALLAHAGVRPGTVTTPFAPTRLRWLRSRWDLRFRPYAALV